MQKSAASARQRIIEAHRYRPCDPRLAERGYVDVQTGRHRETIKLPGDKVIDERGYCWEVK